MANGYYYLIASLHELNLTDKNVQFDLISYRDFILESLDTKDAELLKLLYYPYDIKNLCNLIKQEEADWYKAGNYSRSALETMLQEPSSFPDFLLQFHDETHMNWDKWSIKQLSNYATTLYNDWCLAKSNIFLKKWFDFDQNLHNLLVYLNSEKFNFSSEEEILGNNFEAEYLRETKIENASFDWWDFPVKKVQSQFDNPNIALREYLLDEIRWNYLSELEEDYSFGIEGLLAHAIRLQIINRNIVNTEEAGKESLHQLMDNIRSEYKIPETFI